MFYSFNNLTYWSKKDDSIDYTLACLFTGHFINPTVLRKNIGNGEETQLVCNTKGGFPVPNIYWIINHTQRPPETRVITYVNTIPLFKLYNITSVLFISISPDTAVSCVVENDVLNKTLSATNCECFFHLQ